MSAAPGPPPPTKDTAPTTATVTLPAATGFSAMWVALAMIPAIFFIAFHVGAGYLSYQKYGSGFWAFVDFIFAYFYYPYYAFFLAKEPGPSMGMIGGRKSLAKMLLGKYIK